MTSLKGRWRSTWVTSLCALLIVAGCEESSEAPSGGRAGAVSGGGAGSGAGGGSGGGSRPTPGGAGETEATAGATPGAGEGGANLGGAGPALETSGGADLDGLGGFEPAAGGTNRIDFGGAASGGMGSAAGAGNGATGNVRGDGDGGGGEGGSAFQLATLPCAVRLVLAARCTTCHSAIPIDDAPMSLESWEDVNVYALAIQEKLEQELMPPPTAPSLTEAQLATLLDYVSMGAPPAASPVCP